MDAAWEWTIRGISGCECEWPADDDDDDDVVAPDDDDDDDEEDEKDGGIATVAVLLPDMAVATGYAKARADAGERPRIPTSPWTAAISSSRACW